tara:strand:- start:1178 stop:1798 length:621 start_codon:yes stop_codon:yes gene_type:complete
MLLTEEQIESNIAEELYTKIYDSIYAVIYAEKWQKAYDALKDTPKDVSADTGLTQPTSEENAASINKTPDELRNESSANAPILDADGNPPPAESKVTFTTTYFTHDEIVKKIDDDIVPKWQEEARYIAKIAIPIVAFIGSEQRLRINTGVDFTDLLNYISSLESAFTAWSVSATDGGQALKTQLGNRASTTVGQTNQEGLKWIQNS